MRLDFDEIRQIAKENKPKMIIAGYSAYPRTIDFKQFKEIADEVGAYFIADIAHIAGLVATRFHPSPAEYADVITSTTHKTLRGPRGGLVMCKEEYTKKIDAAVFPGLQGGPLENIIAAKAVCFQEAMSLEFDEYANQILKNSKALGNSLQEHNFDLITGGTDNHLILVDLTNRNMNGQDAQEQLEEVGIIVNKNVIPFDKNPPTKPSGMRIGTAAMTTRLMSEKQMDKIGELIALTLSNKDNSQELLKVKKEVQELTKSFPIYEEMSK